MYRNEFRGTRIQEGDGKPFLGWIASRSSDVRMGTRTSPKTAKEKDMRKTLLTAMVAGVLCAPAAYAQVSLGGGGGIGVNTGPVGLGANGRGDAGIDARNSRIDSHASHGADGRATGNVVGDAARTVAGSAQAGAGRAKEAGATTRDTAGAQAGANASAQAVESVTGNANAATHSVLGAADATTTSADVTGQGRVAGGLDSNANAAANAAVHAGANAGGNKEEAIDDKGKQPAKGKDARDQQRKNAPRR